MGAVRSIRFLQSVRAARSVQSAWAPRSAWSAWSPQSVRAAQSVQSAWSPRSVQSARASRRARHVPAGILPIPVNITIPFFISRSPFSFHGPKDNHFCQKTHPFPSRFANSPRPSFLPSSPASPATLACPRLPCLSRLPPPASSFYPPLPLVRIARFFHSTAMNHSRPPTPADTRPSISPPTDR